MVARKRKLTEADKHEILDLYRQPEHTTLTLAEIFGVSNSTISRWLKNSLSPEEYEVLIQQKRSSRGGGEKRKTRRSRSPSPSPAAATEDTEETSTRRRRRKRSTDSDVEIDVPSLAEAAPPQLVEQLAMFDAEEDDMEDDDLEEEAAIETPKPSKRTPSRRSSRRGEEVTVLPLSEATLPQAFYLVVDRAAELITRPLKEFDELGPVPDSETQQRTLPIFDNHRVARRFSARNQRVIKVPDSNLLQKAVSYLQDKGITRLLFDGRVYALDR